MMGFVAKYYEELVSTFMKRFSTVIEPLIILFMGVIVGVVITAMFLPLINIAKLSGGGG
jgi:type IV pilus assembly protein PilC